MIAFIQPEQRIVHLFPFFGNEGDSVASRDDITDLIQYIFCSAQPDTCIPKQTGRYIPSKAR